MKKAVLGVTLMVSVIYMNAANAGFWPFQDDEAGASAAMQDMAQEFRVFRALFSDSKIRKGSNVKVLSMGDTVLIAGTATDEELKQEVEEKVLDTVGVARVEGDAIKAKPAVEQLCEKEKQHLFNDRRKFNLKNRPECSEVTRVFNRVAIQPAGDALSRGKDAVLTAQVELALMEKNALKKEGVAQVKIASIDGVVYMLCARELENREQIAEWISGVTGVRKVEMVF